MKMVYTNNLQNMIDNESCNMTLTPNLGVYFTTNTFGENIKIYYDFSKEES